MKKGGKALILSLSIAGGALLAPVIAWAEIDITVAPPAALVEVGPAPRPGFVWAPGYWGGRGGAHVWVGGRWIAERPGRHWVPDHWEQHGDRWHYREGYWAR
jgi:hypothetical protein